MSLSRHRLYTLALCALTAVTSGCEEDPVDNDDGGSGSGGGGNGGNGGAGGGAIDNTPVPSDHNCDAATGSLPNLTLTPVIQNLTRPLLAKSPRGDNDRLFVIEQRGVISVWQNNQLTPFLDLSAKVGDNNELDNENGLLGLAFHPGFQHNGRFFVHYSSTLSHTVIAEYRISATDPNVADPVPVTEPLFFHEQPFLNHNGGSIEFSPIDNLLYIGLGDGGAGGDPSNRSQNLEVALGKILRIDVDSGTPYAIPPGNMPGGLPEIWDNGMRNPWRFSFDGCNGDLYIGDVGQDAVEEIDYEAVGDGNRNYGWRLMEADACFNPATSCDPGGLTGPVVSEPHTNTPCDSIVGGYVYRGHAIPALRGTYLYADTCRVYIKAFTINDGVATNPIDLTSQLVQAGVGNIFSFGEDNNGELYVLAGGTVFRLDAQ